MDKNFVTNKLYAGIQKFDKDLDVEKAWELAKALAELGGLVASESQFAAAVRRVYPKLTESDIKLLAQSLVPLALPKRRYSDLYNSFGERQKRAQL